MHIGNPKTNGAYVPTLTNVLFNVAGMTCHSCVTTITNHLKTQNDINYVNIDLPSGKVCVELTITNDRDQRITELKDLIEEVGFEATFIGTRILLIVNGMTCQSCVSTITNHLTGKSFIENVHINLDNKEVNIDLVPDYDVNQANVLQLVDLVEEVGFEATPAITQAATEVLLYVTGMTCQSCVNTITNHLKDQTGIVNVNINLVRGEVRVEISSEQNEKLTMTKLVDLINEVGFDATFADILKDDMKRKQVKKKKKRVIDSNINNGKIQKSIKGKGITSSNASVVSISILIQGMTCASCVNAIESRMDTVLGVHRCTVNLLLGEATADYDPTVITKDQVAAEIDTLGYKAEIKSPDKKYDPRKHQQETVQYYKRLFVFALVFAIPSFILAMIIPLIHSAELVLKQPAIGNLPWQGLWLWLLASPVQFWVGRIFIASTLQGLRHCTANMGLLITLGSGTAYLVALITTIRCMIMATVSCSVDETGHFETSTILLTFILLGRTLEHIAKGKTGEALNKLMSLQVETTCKIELDTEGKITNSEEDFDVNKLVKGDFVKVVRGGKIPCDGVIVHGSCYIDESMITGESLPVSKKNESKVTGATVVQEGTIYVKITAVGEETTLAQIIKLMEKAQSSKAPIQRFADKVASVFVPIVVAITLITFFSWYTAAYFGAISPNLIGDSGIFLFAYQFAVATVVIACPCALGLATPTAVMVGTGIGAKYGVLIKGAGALEMASKVDTIVFDKTGTLTMGQPRVNTVRIIAPREKAGDIKFLAYLAGSAELDSEHVLGKAVVDWANEHSSKPLVQPTEFEGVSGRGLRCRVDTHSVIIGNRAWMNENKVEFSLRSRMAMEQAEMHGETALGIAIDDTEWGVLGIADTIKPEAKNVVNKLVRMNFTVYMCTGDNKRTANVVAQEVGITKVVSEAMPNDKYNLVETLQKEGKIVAMIGDGINDSPALIKADLGITLADATDVAKDAAQVILVKNNLLDVLMTFDLSKKVISRIKQNFAWAIGYNLLGIPIAAGVLYPFIHFRLPAEVASFCMAMSSVSVVCSSLLLNTYKKPTLSNIKNSSVTNISALVNDKDNASDALLHNIYERSSCDCECKNCHNISRTKVYYGGCCEANCQCLCKYNFSQQPNVRGQYASL